MPLFFTPKPRQFHYEPRFYDPEKEKWEALKKKYAATEESTAEKADETVREDTSTEETSANEDLHYFEEKVRRMDRAERQQAFGWKDLFRKREMPKFNYQPRFQSSESSDSDADTATAAKYSTGKDSRHIRIRRRYNMDDPEYMKPVSAGKIMIYVLLACMLLYWILF